MNDPIEKLSSLFLKFPGIGKRQARRFVYHILGSNTTYAKDLADNILSIKKSVVVCPRCHRFFPLKATSAKICDICGSEQTDHGIIMVVERDADLENIRKSGIYNGTYFVLGGTLPLHDAKHDEFIRSKELFERVSDDVKDGNLKEIILALSATTEGEHTTHYLKQLLDPIIEKHAVPITLLGRGLSTGTELEYSDSDTLKSALKNRA